MSLRFTAQQVRGIYNIMPTPAVPGADRWDCEDSVDYDETVRLLTCSSKTK